jgi:crotonobetainyl-CoA:carnitine CoA-transferase CaiB-like acyl-CoA transferase
VGPGGDVNGVRVLAIDPDLAGGYCARLFASVGADVVFAEPTGGAALRRHAPIVPGVDGTDRSAMWEYLATGSRSVVVDAADPGCDALLGWADVVISSCDGDADGALALHDRVRRVAPHVVHVVTSGYGLTGPYRNWRRTPLTDWAAGGHLAITGDPDREPLQGGGPWVSYLTGATAAIGAMAALIAAARTGRGELVDVGAFEAAASLHQWTITMFTHTGVVKRRWGNRFGESVHPIALYRCRDGWISIVAPAVHQFEALCIAVDNVEILADEEIMAPAVRFDRAAEIDGPVDAWLAERTVADAVATLQAAGVPASPVLRMSEVLDDEQLAARQYWTTSGALGARHPRAPFRLTSQGAGDVTLGDAPAPGEHTDSLLAAIRKGIPRAEHPVIDLREVRLLEFGVAWAGPLAGRFLGDLGVDVVMVEHPATRGIHMRTDTDPNWRRGELPAAHLRFPVFPDATPGERWWNRMGMFNKMNRSKRSLCLDAKSGDGPAVLRELLGATDVVLHNFSPRGARSLGIDAASVARHNPAAVTVSMSGYGETGPLAGYLSYGPVLQAHGGFDEATGYEGGDPVRIGVAFPDAVGGLHGAFAALVAIWERARTAAAVHVDLSQLETLLAIAGDMVLATGVTGEDPVRHGNRASDAAHQGVHPSQGEDAWVAITARDGDDWRALVDVVGSPALTSLRDTGPPERAAAIETIDAAIGAWTAARSPYESAHALQAAGVPAFPVMTNAMIVEDPHMTAREFIVTWDQTDAGPLQFPGFPIHFGESEVHLKGCPGLGEDNAAVLQDLLGADDTRLAELMAAGTIADRPPA